jgi:tRNA threonylcarbamoyladenosine biosynthesis protein TsaE
MPSAPHAALARTVATTPALSHPPILETRRLHWPDEQACQRFAGGLATRPALRDAYIELLGPLGAGKTSLVRHLLRALGITGRIKSPTYAVLEPYETADGLAISHFDFYRFTDPREWEDAGLRDIFTQPGLKLAEWPEQAAGALPPADLRIAIAPVPDSDGARQVELQAFSVRGQALLT